jgi:hypothetical protein
MRLLLRVAAIAIAIAGVVDPAIARRATAPLAVDILMPRESEPDHGRAVRIRKQVAAVLEGRAVLDGANVPDALIAIGPAVLADVPGVPLFTVPLVTTPSLSIQGAHVPAGLHGQSAPVDVTLRGIGLAGRTTSVVLSRSGTAVDRITHRWKADDERVETRLGFVPAAPGLHRVRVTADTSGLEDPATADVAVAIRDRRLRVLAYEPRPSWPLAFVRRSLEADALFDVTATVRTTNRSATTSAGAPASLSAVQADRFDAILVGAPEALTDADTRALDAFVSRRGGTLILLPDRPFTAPVGRRFGLPAFDEVVLEGPLALQPPGPLLRASELLLPPPAGYGFEAVRVVRHGDRDRAVMISVLRGEGRLIVSGALDAWRYRADADASFDMFWRGLVADAAAAAPPRLAVTIEPSVVRPGDDLTVSVTLRPTELTAERGVIEVPAVEAELVATGGNVQKDPRTLGPSDPRTLGVRLWPDVTPGVYTARLQAPRAGEYALSVRAAGTSADAPLLVAGDVVHPASTGSRAANWAVETSGGAVVTDVEDLAGRITALDASVTERRTRPMRSPWWIVPFAGLLCAEWALRRRVGER